MKLHSEIVQVPAILINGIFKDFPPDQLAKMSPDKLKGMADLLGGTLVYRKMRITYTPPEQTLCTKKDCYRPVKKPNTFRCDDHRTV